VKIRVWTRHSDSGDTAVERIDVIIRQRHEATAA
jgi:hypothetical protein